MKGKSNEITAIPELLELLDLRGAAVTIDAIGTQRAIVDQIIQKGGHYVLPAKENQKTLVENLESVMVDLILDHQKGLPSKLRYHEQKEEAHGRCEVRKIWLSDDVSLLRPNVHETWPTIGGIAMVERYRQDYGDSSGNARRDPAPSKHFQSQIASAALLGGGDDS